jgi:hypothetical protein
MAGIALNGEDVISEINIRLRASGAMSVSGNIGDTRAAVAMIDHARDAVKRQLGGRLAIVPASDVDVPLDPAFPVREARETDRLTKADHLAHEVRRLLAANPGGEGGTLHEALVAYEASR